MMKAAVLLSKIKWVSYLVICIVTLHAFYYASEFILQPTTMPINQIEVLGPMQHVSAQRIHNQLTNKPLGNFFTIDLQTIQQQLTEIPWVSSVSVRRKWPETLQIEFDEYSAVARWGDIGLIDFQGHVFLTEEATQDEFSALPILMAPDSHQKEIWQIYHDLTAQLTRVNRSIHKLDLSSRLAWTIELDNGLVLKMGREKLEQRLALFIEMYPSYIEPEQDKIEYIDLRYDFGYAIGWKVAVGEEHKKERV